jgi:two-component system, LuxR family, response regulator FixJ
MTTRSIYIVDDDQAVRAALQSLLSTQPNVLVFGYRSGTEFVAQIGELEPGCILLDYDMPGMNGLDVLRAISGMTRKFGAIMLTGQGATNIAVQAWKLGALDFLEKPCDPALLLGTVEDAYAKIEESHRAVTLAERAKSAIATLSARETNVLNGLIEGRANKVIAYDLDISPRTVEIYRANMMSKLNVRSLSEVLRIAFAAGLIPSD